MTHQQDVLDPRRNRRRIPTILLGVVAASAATAAVVAGGTVATPEVQAAAERSAAASIVNTRAVVTPAVTAPGTLADVKFSVQTITVTVPKPVVKKPVYSPRVASSSGSTSVRKASVRTGLTASRYCANPNPVSASGTTSKSFLAAVNDERAKIGARPLSWSSSMASTALSWSKTMLSRDLKTSKLIDGLAHNPNRPGAENVAVIYRSSGYSGSSAVSKLHKNLVHSDSHCLNLMNPKWRTVGAGLVKSSDGRTWYVTENFR